MTTYKYLKFLLTKIFYVFYQAAKVLVSKIVCPMMSIICHQWKITSNVSGAKPTNCVFSAPSIFENKVDIKIIIQHLWGKAIAPVCSNIKSKNSVEKELFHLQYCNLWTNVWQYTENDQFHFQNEALFGLIRKVEDIHFTLAEGFISNSF